MERTINCQQIGDFKTSWCDILSCNEKIVHFWHKIDEIKEEVRKRTSYLGKYRATENIPHLLEQISMTGDEEDIFMPFLRAAAADVFDKLILFTNCDTSAFHFNESLTEVPFINSPDTSVEKQGAATNNGDISQQVKFTFNQFDFTQNKLSVSIKIDYRTSFTLIGQSNRIMNDKSVVIDHVVGSGLSGLNNESIETITFTPELQGAGMVTTEESFDSITKITIISEEYSPINPIELKKDSYVKYGSKYYLVLSDCDSSDMDIMESDDYSKCVHYMISVPCKFNDNALRPADISLFECLVNLTIFKWLLISYKDEAKTYYDIYLDEAEKLRSRMQSRCGKTNIIPRPF